MLWAGGINLLAAAVLAGVLMIAPSTQFASWWNVAIFAAMPVMGLIIFVRDMPPPELTFYEAQIRQPWQRLVNGVLHIVFAFVPWWLLVTQNAG